MGKKDIKIQEFSRINIVLSTEGREGDSAIEAYHRAVTIDGKEVYRDRIMPYHYLHGKDLLSRFVLALEYEAGYRSDIRHTGKNPLRKRGIGLLEILKLRAENIILRLKLFIVKTKIFLYKKFCLGS